MERMNIFGEIEKIFHGTLRKTVFLKLIYDFQMLIKVLEDALRKNLRKNKNRKRWTEEIFWNISGTKNEV